MWSIAALDFHSNFRVSIRIPSGDPRHHSRHRNVGTPVALPRFPGYPKASGWYISGISSAAQTMALFAKGGFLCA